VLFSIKKENGTEYHMMETKNYFYVYKKMLEKSKINQETKELITLPTSLSRKVQELKI